MNWLDVIISIILLLTAILGLIRGVVREVFSLAALLVAFAFANYTFAQVDSFVRPFLAFDAVRNILVYLVLFVVVAFFAAVIGGLISGLLKTSKPSAFDRFFGGIVGIAKGAVIATIIVFLLSIGFSNGRAAISHSRMTPLLKDSSTFVMAHLPEELNHQLPDELKKLKGASLAQLAKQQWVRLINIIRGSPPVAYFRNNNQDQPASKQNGNSSRQALDRLIENADR